MSKRKFDFGTAYMWFLLLLVSLIALAMTALAIYGMWNLAMAI